MIVVVLFLNGDVDAVQTQVGQTGSVLQSGDVGESGAGSVQLIQVGEVLNAVQSGDSGVADGELLQLLQRGDLLQAGELGELGSGDESVQRVGGVAQTVHAVKLSLVAALGHGGQLGNVECTEHTQVAEQVQVGGIGELIDHLCHVLGIIGSLLVGGLVIGIGLLHQSVGIGLIAQHDHGVCVGLHGGSVHAYAAEVYQTFKTVQILLGEVVLGRESQSVSDSGSKVLIAEVLIEGHFVGDADHDGACQHDEHQSTTNNCGPQLFLLLLLVDRCHVVSSET